jgi:hypothetical protein
MGVLTKTINTYCSVLSCAKWQFGSALRSATARALARALTRVLTAADVAAKSMFKTDTHRFYLHGGAC